MSDEALANAFAELHSLQDRHKELDAQIATLNQSRAVLGERIVKAAEFIVAWHGFAGKPVPTTESVLTSYRKADEMLNSPAPLKVTGNPKKEAVAAATADIALELNRPVPRPELHRLLKDRGLDVRGTDPLVTLSTMLWRMKDRIVHIPGKGYWPINVRYVDADVKDEQVSENLSAEGVEKLINDESGKGLFG